MAFIDKCPCGNQPNRERKQTRQGVKFRVYCPKCKRKTHWHRPNGGDLHEWKSERVGKPA